MKKTPHSSHMLQKKGFTLVETLVSITILALAVSAFTGLVATSLRTYRVAQERSVAAQIAQEGMEMVISKKRNIDSGDVSQCSMNDLVGDWYVDITKPEELLCGRSFEQTPRPSSGPLANICYEGTALDATGFTQCGPSANATEVVPGSYSREAHITGSSNPYVDVEVIVHWKSKELSSPQSITLEDILFNDQQ